MRIAITHMSSDTNKGDYAILSATVNGLREVAPSSQVVAVSAELPHAAVNRPVDTRLTRALGCDIVGTPVPSLREFDGGRLRWGLTLLRAELFVWATRVLGDRAQVVIPREDRAFFRTLADADLVIAKGGSYLHALGGIGETIYLWRMLYPLRIAHLYGRRTILFGVSFGERYSLLTKAMLRATLRSSSAVYTREQISCDFARTALGVSREKLQLVPDLAFLIRNEIRDRPTGRPLAVGVTVRHNRFSALPPALALRQYMKAIVSVLRELLESHADARIVFVPQVLEDIPLADEIATQLGQPDRTEVIAADLTLEELLKVYTKLDVVIGTRLHSVIMAAVTGIPFVHIVVEPAKSYGTLAMLEMEKAGLAYDGITDDALMGAVEDVILNRQRLSDHLRRRVTGLRSELTRVLEMDLGQIGKRDRVDDRAVEPERSALECV